MPLCYNRSMGSLRKISVQLLNQSCRRYSSAFRMAISDLHELGAQVVKYLKKTFGINPVIIGGIAVHKHGYERTTTDLDILVSKIDYRKLVDSEKIKDGKLVFSETALVDVLVEGFEGVPGPEQVRDGKSVFPTFAGLIWLKMCRGLARDETDVIELLKRADFSKDLHQDITEILPKRYWNRFEQLWGRARAEYSREASRKSFL